LDIDEIAFKTFPQSIRSKCEDSPFEFEPVPSTTEECLTGLFVACFPKAVAKAEAWVGFYSQTVMVFMAIGCVFGFIDHIFLCSRWNAAPSQVVPLLY
jgi:hypothetical protein